VNQTHDPGLKSWVESAEGHPDFPIQNLPFGVFRRIGTSDSGSIGIAIGNEVLDLRAALETTPITGAARQAAEACTAASLNPLLALGRSHWSALRQEISALLASDSPAYRKDKRLGERILVPQAQAELLLPVEVGDYSDFYASIHHASNVGRMFRPDNPLLPNYKWMPIGYHGRASSIVVSGTSVRRPHGQLKGPGDEPPVFAPSRALDYEMEVGCFVGPGNALGQPVPLERAEEHLFGMSLVNDWSARDIQTWEYQPLGPFLAKSFATTVSPWVVSFEALEPYRVPAVQRPAGDPEPLPYLDADWDRARGGVDLSVEVYLLTSRMRDAGMPAHRLSRGNMAELYWTVGQMLAHHTSNGCNLRPGDLFASGTISGTTRESRGCLLELTSRGSEPIQLPSGESRKFLEDGDEVIMRGYCERPKAARLGFGECRGVILPA
jgi:fumarylacetoacetase